METAKEDSQSDDLSSDEESDGQQQADQKTLLFIDDLPPAPDGGWGWVVVTAATLQSLVSTGLAGSLGIYLNDLVMVITV